MFNKNRFIIIYEKRFIIIHRAISLYEDLTLHVVNSPERNDIKPQADFWKIPSGLLEKPERTFKKSRADLLPPREIK